MNFRVALAISFLVHSLVIAPISGLLFVKDRDARQKDMTVDYVVVEKLSEKERDKPDIRRKDSPRLEVSKNVDVKPASPASAKRPKADAARQNAEDQRQRETRIKSTKDYISYYQLIREKIRRRLKDRYRDYHNEGEVALTFVLNSSGAVEAIAIDPSNTTAGKALRDIAVASVSEASPYPAFPKAITLKRMSFSVQISFQKE